MFVTVNNIVVQVHLFVGMEVVKCGPVGEAFIPAKDENQRNDADDKSDDKARMNMRMTTMRW